MLRTCRFTVASVTASRSAICALLTAPATRPMTSTSRCDSPAHARPYLVHRGDEVVPGDRTEQPGPRTGRAQLPYHLGLAVPAHDDDTGQRRRGEESRHRVHRVVTGDVRVEEHARHGCRTAVRLCHCHPRSLAPADLA